MEEEVVMYQTLIQDEIVEKQYLDSQIQQVQCHLINSEEVEDVGFLTEENILPALSDTSPCTYNLFNDTSILLLSII